MERPHACPSGAYGGQGRRFFMSDRSSSTPECGAAEPALPLERSSSGAAPFCSPEHSGAVRPPGRPLPEAAEGNRRCCSTPGCTSHQLHPAAHSAFSPPSPMDAAATASLWAKVSGTGGSSCSKAKQLAFVAQDLKSDKAVSACRPHLLSRASSSSAASDSWSPSRAAVWARRMRCRRT